MTNFSKYIEDDFFLMHGEATKAFSLIADGKVVNEDIKKFLLQINKFGITKKLLFEAAAVYRKRMRKINFSGEAIDVCGTGGDGVNSLNISTAVCFVLSSAGVKVAKHGNRAVSSKSGSSDLLQEIGVKINCGEEEILENLENNNLAFLFAPNFHPAFRHVAQARKELKIKTIFNYLGPLLNPLEVKKQMIGVSNLEIVKFMPQIFLALGGKECISVHGLDGMDEISISDNTIINKTAKINKEDPMQSTLSEEIFNPEDYGFKKVDISEIRGGDVKYNAKRFIELFQGKKDAYYDIVVLNSAFALMLAKKASNVKEGIELAKEVLKKNIF